MHSFEDMTIWIFCRFGLKWLFTPPKRDWSSSRPPKGTSLAETALSCQFWCRSVAWCDLCARRRNQKKERKKKERKKGKERNLQWQIGCSPRPPTLTQRYVVLHAGWSLVEIWGGQNLPFPILKASGLYNSLYYRTSRDTINLHCRHSINGLPIHSLQCIQEGWLSPTERASVSAISLKHILASPGYAMGQSW